MTEGRQKTTEERLDTLEEQVAKLTRNQNKLAERVEQVHDLTKEAILILRNIQNAENINDNHNN